MEGGLRVWVNGAFDVLHIGHIQLLKRAKEFGSVRVGVDSDARVAELKGDSRPFNKLSDRIDFLKSIRYVDEIVSYDSEEELTNQIKLYEPDIMVIGSDYMGKRIVGAEYITQIVFFDRIEHKSTTSILGYEAGGNR